MKKIFKNLTIVLVLLVSSLSFVACGGPKAKTFTSDAGLSITLNDSFYEKNIVSQTMYLESKTMIFVALKEDFTTVQNAGYNPTTMTLMDYAALVIKNNKLNVSAKFDEQNNLTYINYQKSVSGKNFNYYAVVFKGTDAFWLCQFGCESKNYNSYKSQFVNFAKTIKVS